MCSSDLVSATVVSKDDGNGNILLSRTEAADVLAWDKLKELKDSKEVIDVVVKEMCIRDRVSMEGIQEKISKGIRDVFGGKTQEEKEEFPEESMDLSLIHI